MGTVRLLLLLACFSASAQLPVIPWRIPPAGTNNPPFNNNLVFWYEATDAVTNTNGVAAINGDVINIWGDRWTNHYNLTNALTSASVLCSYHTGTGPNSKPWIGTPSGVGSSGLSNKFSTTYAQTNTYYLVGFINGVSTGTAFDGIGARNYFGALSGGNSGLFAGSSANVNFAAANAFLIYTIQFAGAASSFRVNGSNFITGLSVGAQGLQSFVIGNRTDMANPGTNAYCEILMYNHPDTTNDNHVVEDYLSVKYNIPVADK